MIMQLERILNKKESSFLATIASYKEDNVAKRSSLPCSMKENNTMMPKKSLRRVTLKKEVDHKITLEEIKK